MIIDSGMLSDNDKEKVYCYVYRNPFGIEKRMNIFASSLAEADGQLTKFEGTNIRVLSVKEMTVSEYNDFYNYG